VRGVGVYSLWWLIRLRAIGTDQAQGNRHASGSGLYIIIIINVFICKRQVQRNIDSCRSSDRYTVHVFIAEANFQRPPVPWWAFHSLEIRNYTQLLNLTYIIFIYIYIYIYLYCMTHAANCTWASWWSPYYVKPLSQLSLRACLVALCRMIYFARD